MKCEKICYWCKWLGCRTCGSDGESLESYCTYTNDYETGCCEHFEERRNEKGELLDTWGRVVEEEENDKQELAKMKRFIRTKDGKIIDTSNKIIEEGKTNDFWIRSKHSNISKRIGTIIDQADTFTDLIKVGDLIREQRPSIDMMFVVKYITKQCGICADVYSNLQDSITELYTRQGDNYIFVAKKINGEWRVI